MFRYFILLVLIVLCVQIGYAQPDSNSSTNQAQNGNANLDAVAVQSPVPHVENKSETEAETYRKERDAKDDTFRTQQTEQNEVIKNANWWVAVFAGVSVFFGFVLTVVACLQWRQTKILYELANRPVIGIEKVELENRKTRAPKNILVTLRNSGRSPAKNCQIESYSNFFTKEEVAKFDKALSCPDPYKDPPIKGTSSRMVVSVESFRYARVKIAPDEWKRIRNETTVLFSWTIVTYENLAGKEYFVEGYFMYDFGMDKMKGCPNHNDAT